MPYPNTNSNKKKYPWMAQVKVNGEKKRKQFKTKRAARQWEEEQRNGSQSMMTLTPSLHEWAIRYLQYAEKEFVVKTFQEKRTAFKLLLNNEEIDPDGLTSSLEPLAVLDHLQEQAEERSGNAANKDRKNLAAAWKWGVKYIGLPIFNPIAAVEKFAEDRHERPLPTLEDFYAVVSACETEQDRIMLWTYLQTGARREELFRLGWKDVDFKKQQIRLYWRKNKKGQWEEAWLPVKDDLIKLLKSHQKVTGLQKFVFLNFNGSTNPRYWLPYLYRQHWLKNLCEDAGVKQFGFHGIRHLFASILAAQNVPLVEIQYMLRHKHLTTTQRYIHRLKKENRDVIKVLPNYGEIVNGPLKAHQKRTGT